MCRQHFQALNRHWRDSQHTWSQRLRPSLSRTCHVSMVYKPLMNSRSQSSQRDNHYTLIVLALMRICLENTTDRKRIRSRPCIYPSNTPCNLDRLARNSHSCTYSWSTLCSPAPEYVCAGQSLQSVSRLTATTVLYVPCKHGEHACGPFLSLYVPAGHA